MSLPTLAFFGATGGCAGFCLANALNAGHDCIAQARTPAKLTQAMKDKGVSTATLDAHLTIVQGNVKDVEAVKSALQLKGKVVDMIISGVGGTPKLQWSLFKPVILTDARICRDAGATILQALTELKADSKPTFIHVSTTGIPPKGMPRDVPLLFVPFYYWALQDPHEDKRELQENLARHMQLPVGERGIGAYVNVKASLLMDGEGHGLGTVREGVDEKPAVGYTIQRKDVGLFMYERLIKSGVRREWQNKSVSITY